MKKLPAKIVAETAVALLLSSLMIRVRPTGAALRFQPWRGGGRGPASTEDIALIRRCIEGWSRRMPWRTKCLEQGLASHWLLSRRGHSSTLHYGAAPIDGELKAHVWVTSGDRPVVGCENSADYALLARFSNVEPSSKGSHLRG